jgi:hypothetical protein
MTPCSLEAAPRFADTHYEAYARGCAEIGIPPHPRTQPKEEDLGERYAQLVVRLEWLVTCWVAVFFSAIAQGPVPWTREGLHRRIVRFVVTHDEVGRWVGALHDHHAMPYLAEGRSSQLACFLFQPFSVVDWPEFRDILKFQRPATEETDIPHRKTISKMVGDTAECVQQRIKVRYKVRCCFIAWIWIWTLSSYCCRCCCCNGRMCPARFRSRLMPTRHALSIPTSPSRPITLTRRQIAQAAGDSPVM